MKGQANEFNDSSWLANLVNGIEENEKMSRNALSEITSLNSNNSSYPETKNPSLHNIYTIERKKSEDTVLKNTSSVGSKSKSKSKEKINSL